ncbi:MAG TPA: metallophosphoesterase family protein [Terriglobales bacterium]|nr:metallophosphoesterase family protein [Terriglobales bacterium]
MTARLAILADIHANIWALDAVLAHAKSRGIDRFLNLGDSLYGPLKPQATYERLMQANVLVTIQGNQDRLIYEASERDLASIPTLSYVIRDLGEEPIHWLSELPRTAVFEENIFLCHGTPGNDTIYLLEDIMDGLPEVRSEGAIRELLQGVHHPVVLCGHTHIPRVVDLAHGQLVVNPGSIGVQAYDDVDPVRYRMQTFSPHACYAILEKSNTGWNVSLERVAYDHRAAAEFARTRGRDDWAQGIATGRIG